MLDERAMALRDTGPASASSSPASGFHLRRPAPPAGRCAEALRCAIMESLVQVSCGDRNMGAWVGDGRLSLDRVQSWNVGTGLSPT